VARADIEEKLTRFILDELLEEDPRGEDPLTVDELDSLGLEQLVEYIDEAFGVTVRGEEMVRENFKSIPALRAFVESRLAEPRA